MSHSDSIIANIYNIDILSLSENGSIAAYQVKEKPIYGLLFHPEVSHTQFGYTILKNFAINICHVTDFITLENTVSTIKDKIRSTLQESRVLMAISGGVDSTVAAMLIHSVIGDRLHCIFIDNGLLRENEYEEVLECYQTKLNLNVKGINATELFLSRLQYVSNPEEKRKIIGKTFIDVFKKYSQEINRKYQIEYLGQGTIYSDVIESSVENKQSRTIKSHHNVGCLPENLGFKLIEPIKHFFKDEVREIGKTIGIPNVIINRHPFPGPGLAIRIIGEITSKKVNILQRADKIFISMLKEENLYNKIWQAGAILLNTKSVGVMGDNRTYQYVLVLRAVCSRDGMTAKIYPFKIEFLERVSSNIINNVNGINRVVYDISSKPPATIDLE